eukprot:g14021.t1
MSTCSSSLYLPSPAAAVTPVVARPTHGSEITDDGGRNSDQSLLSGYPPPLHRGTPSSASAVSQISSCSNPTLLRRERLLRNCDAVPLSVWRTEENEPLFSSSSSTSSTNGSPVFFGDDAKLRAKYKYVSEPGMQIRVMVQHRGYRKSTAFWLDDKTSKNVFTPATEEAQNRDLETAAAEIGEKPFKFDEWLFLRGYEDHVLFYEETEAGAGDENLLRKFRCPLPSAAAGEEEFCYFVTCLLSQGPALMRHSRIETFFDHQIAKCTAETRNTLHAAAAAGSSTTFNALEVSKTGLRLVLLEILRRSEDDVLIDDNFVDEDTVEIMREVEEREAEETPSTASPSTAPTSGTNSTKTSPASLLSTAAP